MTEQEEIGFLKEENQRLQQEINKIQKRKEKKKKVGFWLLKKSSTPLLGLRLKKSIHNALTEYKGQKTISIDTASDVTSNIIWRITRIGIFAFILSIIPSLILLTQTWLVINQNNLVRNQNTLIEAERRSSLVFVMDNVLSDLSKELEDSGNKIISPVLESRIAGLSRSMKPYKYKEGDQLIDEEISPERGQLLYSLVQSDMNVNSFTDIMISSDFSYTYFKDVFLGRGSNLKNAKLNYSNMEGAQLAAVNLERSELRKANLKRINLSDANLKRAVISGTNLQNAELLSADLTYADLSNADLTEADLSETKLWGTKLDNAILDNVILENAIVNRRDWITKFLDSLKVQGASDIQEKYQLKKNGDQQYTIIKR